MACIDPISIVLVNISYLYPIIEVSLRGLYVYSLILISRMSTILDDPVD